MTKLHDFLEAEDNFSWWLVCGDGGSGKSRLALALCDECLSQGWRAGFVKARTAGYQDICRDDWTTWRPTTPTLVILDYAASYMQEELNPGVVSDKADLVHIINALNNASVQSGQRVRLLLLEREYRQKSQEDNLAYPENQTWYSKLVETFAREQAAVTGLRHAEPLILNHLDDDALWRIMQSVAAHEEARLEEGNKADMLKQLREIDPQGRPLFAIFLATITANSADDGGRWDREKLIREILLREYTNYWMPAGLTLNDINLLVFATLCGGVSSLPELPAQVTTLEAMNSDGELLDRFLSLGLAINQGTDVHISPVQPDLVGEYFVLKQNVPIQRGSSVCQLIQAAWRHAPLACARFFDHCRVDFFNLRELFQLFYGCSGRESQGSPSTFLWSLVAFNLVIDYGDAGDLAEARAIFDAMPAGSPELELIHAKAAFNLVNGYRKAGDLAEARAVFDAMPAGSPELELRHAKAAVNLVSAYGDAGDLAEARAIFDAMPAGSPELDLERAKAAVNLVSAYGDAGDLAEARAVFDAMPADDPQLTVWHVAANIVLHIFCGELAEAWRLWENMDDGEIKALLRALLEQSSSQ